METLGNIDVCIVPVFPDGVNYSSSPPKGNMKITKVMNFMSILIVGS